MKRYIQDNCLVVDVDVLVYHPIFVPAYKIAASHDLSQHNILDSKVIAKDKEIQEILAVVNTLDLVDGCVGWHYMRLDIFIVTMKEEVYLLTAVGQLSPIIAADGTCSDNTVFHCLFSLVLEFTLQNYAFFSYLHLK